MFHALLPFLPVLLQVPASDPRTGYDVLAYELDLEVQPATRTLSGTVAVEAAVVAEELALLHLDLGNALEVLSVTDGAGELRFAHDEDRLVCTLARPLARGERVRVVVTYRGQPASIDSFSGFHWAETGDGRPWISTSCQGPGARSWWPCKDSFFHPEDKPERVRMRLTVPAELYGVSNGRLAGIEDLADERRAFTWVHDYPLETYSVTLNVAPYVVVERTLELEGLGPVPFAYYVLPENAAKAAVQFAQVPELVAIYSEAFGPYPFPKSKIGLVETSFWGMEHSTAVAYGSSYPAWIAEHGGEDRYGKRNRWFDYILIHELAHEWWGNAVSADEWGDFWIHEGFGTYAEGVYVEKTQGRDAADRYFAEEGQQVSARGRLYRGAGVDSEKAYAPIIYSKGACVLNTLRHYLDDDALWWRALREFNLRFRYANAGTEEFRAVLEELSGRSWEPFFAQWVYGAGYPKLSGDVSAEPGGFRVRVANQGSADTAFDVPLDLAWKEGGEPRALRLWLPPGEFDHFVPCAEEPTELAVVHLGRVLGRHDVAVR